MKPRISHAARVINYINRRAIIVGAKRTGDEDVVIIIRRAILRRAGERLAGEKRRTDDFLSRQCSRVRDRNSSI